MRHGRCRSATIMVAVLCAVLSILGFSENSFAQGSAQAQSEDLVIVLEGAEATWQASLISSPSLVEEASRVASRIICEHAGTTVLHSLVHSAALKEQAAKVVPRIVLEYGGASWDAGLGVSETLHAFSREAAARIVVEHAHAGSLDQELRGSDLLAVAAREAAPRIAFEHALSSSLVWLAEAHPGPLQPVERDDTSTTFPWIWLLVGAAAIGVIILIIGRE